MVRLMDEDSKQGKTESIAEMAERVAMETAQAERAKQECPDCIRLRGLIKSATGTLEAQQERINKKDAEIEELEERINRKDDEIYALRLKGEG